MIIPFVSFSSTFRGTSIELHLATGEAAPLSLCPGQTYNLKVRETDLYYKLSACNGLGQSATSLAPIRNLPAYPETYLDTSCFQVSFGEPREALVTASCGVMSRAQQGDVLQW